MALIRLFLGVDGGQSSTTALIGDETGRVLGAGRGGPCNHIGASEGRAKLTRAVEECVTKASEQAHLDPAQIRFEAACFGMSGGPDDKESLLSQILSTEKLIVTHDGLIALSGATAGGRESSPSPALAHSPSAATALAKRDAPAAGVHLRRRRQRIRHHAPGSARRAALEEGWDQRPRCATRSSKPPAQATPRCAAPVLHSGIPRSRVATFAQLVDRRPSTATRWPSNSEQCSPQLASLTAAIRRQLWKQGEPARVAYIGGVFHSKLVLERYCELVEMQDGNRCQPPQYGPAAGALLEAYRAAGLHPKLTDLLTSEY
jgi:hypothetical protein